MRFVFNIGLGYIWRLNNDGHEDDSAPSETFQTRWGITYYTYMSALEAGIVVTPFSQCTQVDCARIYAADYYNKLRLDDMPIGAAFAMFVDATLVGAGHVAQLVQRIVGATPDGVIGDKTVGSVRSYLIDPATHVGRDNIVLADAIIDGDEAYERALANAPKFIHGWTRREEEVRQIAFALELGHPTGVTPWQTNEQL